MTVSTIVMAGYNNKRAVRKYAKIVAEHYHERFIETGYKPLREFVSVENGRTVGKPLIQFTLDKLRCVDQVGDVVIVGHQMLLEQRLSGYFQQMGKPCRIVNQNTKLPTALIKRYGIKPRKVKYNSIAGNMIKGYAASAAAERQENALFVASDSPLTTISFIESFLQKAQRYGSDYNIIIPAPVLGGITDRLGRFPLRLLNDTEYRPPGVEDGFGRQGFRLSSVMVANPNGFDLNTANTAYNLRKCLSPNVQYKLFRIMRQLGYPNLYAKYFLRKDLSIREVERITSAFFGGRVKIIPMDGESSTYDYDGTDHEYRAISRMLQSTSSDSRPADGPDGLNRVSNQAIGLKGHARPRLEAARPQRFCMGRAWH